MITPRVINATRYASGRATYVPHARSIYGQLRRLTVAPQRRPALRSSSLSVTRVGAYRARLGRIGLRLPADLNALVSAVTAFADPLATDAKSATWIPKERRWTESTPAVSSMTEIGADSTAD